MRGLDQTIAWIAAFMFAAAVGGGVFFIFRWVAEAREQAEMNEIAESATEAPGADPHGSEPAHAAAEVHGSSHDQPTESHAETAGHSPESGEADSGIKSAEWSYQGATAPEEWGDLSRAYAPCKTGKTQSPVDIVQAPINQRLKPIKFEYNRSDLDFSQENMLFAAKVEHGNYVEIDGEKFDLRELTFHTPSEHLVKGLPYEMEIHFHHRSSTGDLATISLFVAPGKPSAAMATVFKNLPRESGDSREILGINLADMLPKKRHYFHYIGSLTTPPCTQGVRWYVMTDSVGLTKREIDGFVKLARHNARPVHRLGGRHVTRSAR